MRFSTITGTPAAACSVLSADEAGLIRKLAISPEVLTMINDDIRSGQAEAVNGTPTLIITKFLHRYPVGPVSYPVLSRFLDSLLK